MSELIDNALVGKRFHTYTTEGQFEWQGQVTAEVADGLYLVELFSYVNGVASYERLVRVGTMVERGWTFYDSDEAMRAYYEANPQLRVHNE